MIQKGYILSPAVQRFPGIFLEVAALFPPSVKTGKHHKVSSLMFTLTSQLTLNQLTASVISLAALQSVFDIVYPTIHKPLTSVSVGYKAPPHNPSIGE